MLILEENTTMIDNINNNSVSDFLKDSTDLTVNQSKTSANNQDDVSLQLDFVSLLEKANELPQDDGDAVKKAKELISSGQLDTAENIKQAAGNIIKFGI